MYTTICYKSHNILNSHDLLQIQYLQMVATAK